VTNINSVQVFFPFYIRGRDLEWGGAYNISNFLVRPTPRRALQRGIGAEVLGIVIGLLVEPALCSSTYVDDVICVVHFYGVFSFFLFFSGFCVSKLVLVR